MNNYAFTDLLEIFDLKILRFAQDENCLSPKEKMLLCFAKELNVQVEDVIEALNDGRSYEIFSLMLFVEFNSQASWLNYSKDNRYEPFFPVLATLFIISMKFNVNIILCCDFFTLSFIHNGTKIIRIVSNNEFKNSLVLSLKDGNLFYRVHTNNFDKVINALTEDVDEDSILNINEIQSIFQLAVEEYNAKILLKKRKKKGKPEESHKSEQAFNENDGIENSKNVSFFQKRFGIVIFDYLKWKTSLSNGINRVIKETNEIYASSTSRTVTEFVDLFLHQGDDGPLIDESAYNNNTKINFHESDFRYKSESDVEQLKSIDIDGFFGVFDDSQLKNCLNSTGSIVTFKDSIKYKKDRRSIEKLLKDSDKTCNASLKAFKIAEIDAKSRFELIVCSVSAEETNSDFDLIETLKRAHDYANGLPCDEFCPYIKEHRMFKTGRPRNPEQIKTYGYKWEFDRINFKCLIKHMINYLNTYKQVRHGLQFFYVIRNVGSKFKFHTIDPGRLNELVAEYLAPFHLQALFIENGPRIFLDISWKFLHIDPKSEKKVNKLTRLNFLLILSWVHIGKVKVSLISFAAKCHFIQCYSRMNVQIFIKMKKKEIFIKSTATMELRTDCRLIFHSVRFGKLTFLQLF